MSVAKLIKFADKHQDLILDGRLLAIDPSSGSEGSACGYALYHGASLAESGVLCMDHKQSTDQRLQQLARQLSEKFYGKIDIIAIEYLRGRMVPAQLHWAVGTTLASLAFPGTFYVEVPISTWKRYAKQIPEYTKTDEWDAKIIGHSVIQLAREQI